MPKNKNHILESYAFPAKASLVRSVGKRQKIVRFLIVCEGEKTEPNYFKAIIKDPKYSSVLNVKLEGAGKSTTSLIKEAKKIKDRIEYANQLLFDSVWVVFDEDDKTDFNEAVRLAHCYHFKAAWSNEAFELWYYLHFEYLDAGINRHDYIEKLEKLLRKKMGDSHFKYQKNDEHFYAILQKYGNEELAKRYAGKLRKKYHDQDYKSHKPCTRVDLLVTELEHPEKLQMK